MARFLCFILALVVVALASALWRQAGGNNPLIDLLAYAEARAQSVTLDNTSSDQARTGWSTAPAYVPAPPPIASAWPTATPPAATPPAGQWPPGYHSPGEVGPPFDGRGAGGQGSGVSGVGPEVNGVAGAQRNPRPSGEPESSPFPAAAASHIPQQPTATGVVPASYPVTPIGQSGPVADASAGLAIPATGPYPPAPVVYPDTSTAPSFNAPPPANSAPPIPVPQQSAIPNPQSAINPQHVTLNPQPSLAPPQPFERTKVIARVGSEVILLGDVAASVETMLSDAVKAGRFPEEQLPAFREYATRMQVKELVARKLIYLDAKRTIPAANFPMVEEQMAQAWDKDVLRAMVRKMGVDNPAQLDAKLREAGTTLEREKRNFVEQTLASQWLRTKVDDDREISHEAMLEYYQQHVAEYQISARARWEHLMVRIDKARGEAESYARIAQMGNRLWGGVPWAEVARRESEGPTAAQGGLRDWTTRGSLISTVVDRALFELPVGSLSPILKDEQGFHIVRVVERTEAGQTPFSELQASIKDKIRSDRLKQQRNEFVDKLKRGVTIWTIFDGEAAADMVSLEPRPVRKQ